MKHKRQIKYIIWFIIFVLIISSTGLDIGNSSQNIEVQAAGKSKPVIYLLGDSTVETTKEDNYPRAGWGKMFYTYFKGSDQAVIANLGLSNNISATQYKMETITIENHSKSGASTKTVIEKGIFENIKKCLKSGDYVIIQLGHNDAKSNYPEKYTTIKQYKANLRSFIKACRKKGAICILVSPIPRYGFTDSGECKENFKKYRKAMKSVAEEYNVAYIELGEAMEEYLTFIGPVKSQNLYMMFSAKKYKAYPEGLTDKTHLSVKGAKCTAKILVNLICSNSKTKKLAGYLKVNTKALKKTIQKSDKYKSTLYTNTTYKKLKKVRNKALKILYKPTATKGEINKANQALKAAIKALKKRK